MNVKELIAILQNLDGELPVMLPGIDGAYWSSDEIYVQPKVLYPVMSCICTHMEDSDINHKDRILGPPITAVTIC